MNEMHDRLDFVKAMNQKLSEQERMYQLIDEAAENACLYYSFESNSIIPRGQWKAIMGFDICDVRDAYRIPDAVDETCQSQLADVMYPERTGKDILTAECLLKDQKKWVQFRTKVFYDDNDMPTDKLIFVCDITKSHEQKEELTYMAYFDELTGLYNRNYFVSRLTDYLKSASEKECGVCVMMIDIDDFRKVNDGIGLVAGDELIQQFGFFLKSICNENVIAAHLHSDVFCLAIYAPTRQQNAQTVYETIQSRLKDPFSMSMGQDITITVSVGVAEFPKSAASAIELLNYVEIMIYKCNLSGGNSIRHYRALERESFVHSIELEAKIKKAITDREFIMYYQPQYFTGSETLRGVEALIRWRDEENGAIISPSTFIPVAEKNGSIIPLGKWVLEESVRQYSVWKEQFGYPFILSVNISALQYKEDDFVDSVMEVLNRYDVRASEIELEITENVLIDDFDAVSEKLKVLRGYGIRFALDDFGTGFSSLSYLKKLPIDTLKIDKSFIDTVLMDPPTRVITESVINMAKSLGFETIAEGVEEEQQHSYLHDIGCDVIQGYYFSKPLPPAEVESLLSRAG